MMAGAQFLVAGYQKFVADKSMLKRLYGEEDFDDTDAAQETANDGSKDFSAKDTLRAKIEKRKDFNASYYLYTVISYFRCLCCCLASCCKARCKRYLDSHKKFEIAQLRLK